MHRAFSDALEKFGISDPDKDRVEADVKRSVDATREQCARNADKYVSNETFSSTNWKTGEAVGNLIAKAYAAIPDPSGGIQTVVARENSWPAGGISAPDNYGNPDTRVLSRRVVARDVDRYSNGFVNGNSYPMDVSGDALQRFQGPAPPLAKENFQDLSSRIAGNAQASVYEAGAPPTRYLSSRTASSPDGQDTDGKRFGKWTASSGGINPNFPKTVPGTEQPASSPIGRPLGLFTGKPMPQWPVPLPLGGFPTRPADDREPQSSNESQIPLLEQYIRYLNRTSST